MTPSWIFSKTISQSIASFLKVVQLPYITSLISSLASFLDALASTQFSPVSEWEVPFSTFGPVSLVNMSSLFSPIRLARPSQFAAISICSTSASSSFWSLLVFMCWIPAWLQTAMQSTGRRQKSTPFPLESGLSTIHLCFTKLFMT